VTLNIYTKDGLRKGSDYVQQIANLDIWHNVGDAATGLGTAFAANSSNFSASEMPVGFRKSQDGRVQLKGLATIAAGWTNTLFTLPLGYRPTKGVRFVVPSSNGPIFWQVLDTGAVGFSAVTGYASLPAGAWIDLNEVEFDLESVTQWAVPVGIYTPPPLVTSLPTTGLYDGLEVYYLADAVNGVIWHLRYRTGGGTYKWEVLGGSPLVAEVMSGISQPTFQTDTWGSVTGDPTIVAALAGEYNLDWTVGSFSVGAGATMLTGVQVNGVDPVVGNNASYHYMSLANASVNLKNQRKAQVNAGSTIRPRYRHNGGSPLTVSVNSLSLKAMPVRVG
jgi:hypothetical protein